MRRVLAVVLAAALLGGCSDDPAPTPAAVPFAAPSPSPSASATPAQTRQVDAAGDQLALSVGPLIRTGQTVVLTVQTGVLRATASGAGQIIRRFSASGTTTFDGARLVDTTGRRVYLAAEGDGGCVCSRRVRIGEGEAKPLLAAFAGVPADVQRLSVMLPYGGVFADVPVVAGPAPEDLDLDGATSLAADLDAYSERLDVGLRTRQGSGRVDLDLDTDVLFKLDSAELTPAAGKTVAAAVADITAAGPGPLTITGHTDDTGSTEHNQVLSRQRAEAVAKALGMPAAQWPRTVDAKGETEPAVPNTDDANRARNRRVTITFKTTKAQPRAAEGPLPSTDGVRGKASDGVEVAMPLHRGTVRFTPGPAVRNGAFLQVDLVATAVGTGKATILDFLGQGVFTARNEFDPYARYGAAGIRLLAAGSSSFGLDYEVEPGDHRCLCDRLLNQPIPAGSSQTLSLWFPAPPEGTPAVTLDVPDQLRITDIPVRP